jgi:hypothetical protein
MLSWSLASLNLIHSDGLVDGFGTITGNLINNGTVNPGNSPGTLTVGTYTVTATGTNVVEIALASSYDKLVVNAAGGVTLNRGPCPQDC